MRLFFHIICEEIKCYSCERGRVSEIVPESWFCGFCFRVLDFFIWTYLTFSSIVFHNFSLTKVVSKLHLPMRYSDRNYPYLHLWLELKWGNWWVELTWKIWSWSSLSWWMAITFGTWWNDNSHLLFCGSYWEREVSLKYFCSYLILWYVWLIHM